MPSRSWAIGVAAALLAAPLTGTAQERAAPDSLPFRRGQWAAVFQINAFSDFRGIGVLRFTTPTRAWVLDWNVSISSRKDSTEVSGTSAASTTDSRSDDVWRARVQLGRRGYHSLGAHVVALRTLGVTAVLGGRNAAIAGPTNLNSRQADWLVGLFADAGVAYLPIPRVSLGAVLSASVTYGRSSYTDEGRGVTRKTRTHDITASTSAVTLIATLYF